MQRFWVFALMALISIGGSLAAEEAKEPPLEKLQELMKEFSIAMRSGEKEKQIEFLKKVRPTKEDVISLKAERPDEFLQAVERSLKFFEQNLEKFAAQENRGGVFKSAEAKEDELANKDKERRPIGAGVTLYKVAVKYETRRTGRSGFLFLNGRWLWLDFWLSPEEGQKLEPRK